MLKRFQKYINLALSVSLFLVPAYIFADADKQESTTPHTNVALNKSYVLENLPTESNVGTLEVGPPRSEMGKKLWEFETGEAVLSSLAIGSDGIVYFGSRDGYFYALDPTTQTVQWKYKEEASFNSSPVISPDGVPYVGSGDQNVYAFNTETGEKLWNFKTGNAILAMPLIDTDGNIYVGSYDKKFYKINGTTGEKVWEFETKEKYCENPSNFSQNALTNLLYTNLCSR